MRNHRYAIAALALVGSTVLISCGSDNNSNDSPTDSGVIVGDTTLSGGSTGSDITTGIGTVTSDSTP